MTTSNSQKNFSIILAGGSGTRLWPLSSADKPKQFLAIGTKDSLIQQTVKRISRVVDSKNIFTVTHQDHAKMVSQHYTSVSAELIPNIMSEPMAKNTLPAIAWAVAVIHNQHPEAVISVFPSDHVIADEKKFVEVLKLAESVARVGHMTLFGIEADQPSVEYGYIQAKESIEGYGSGQVKKVLRFVEKPDSETAQKYLSEGGYYWNSGMFVFRADVFMNLLKKHQPQIYDIALELVKKHKAHEIKELYQKFPSVSIDYGLMEHLDEAVVIPAQMGWSDLGGWESVYRFLTKDEKGNVKQGESVSLDSSNNLVWNSTDKKIALFGVENLVVIQTHDEILICSREKSADLKRLVTKIKPT